MVRRRVYPSHENPFPKGIVSVDVSRQDKRGSRRGAVGTAKRLVSRIAASLIWETFVRVSVSEKQSILMGGGI